MLWEDDFSFLNGVICRFQPLIFRSLTSFFFNPFVFFFGVTPHPAFCLGRVGWGGKVALGVRVAYYFPAANSLSKGGQRGRLAWHSFGARGVAEKGNVVEKHRRASKLDFFFFFLGWVFFLERFQVRWEVSDQQKWWRCCIFFSSIFF